MYKMNTDMIQHYIKEKSPPLLNESNLIPCRSISEQGHLKAPSSIVLMNDLHGRPQSFSLRH